jgi:hypothetical protein
LIHTTIEDVPMARTPGERKEVGFSIKLSLDEMSFLEQRRKEQNYTSVAEAMRELVNAFRNWFGLPIFLSESLEADMEKSGLSVLAYVREVLGKHAVELQRTSETGKATHRK